MQLHVETTEELDDTFFEARMALELFEIANRTDQVLNLGIFKKFFENPLCRTMFRARTRCFSAYIETVTDPLDEDTANRIVNTILESTDEAGRVEFFFEEMRLLKPFPLSQQHTIEYQYGSKNDFMEQVISSRVGPYLEKRPDACSKLLYRDLKYAIASDIEEKDFCCTDNYEQLMTEIKKYIKKHVLERALVTSSDEMGFFATNKRVKIGRADAHEPEQTKIYNPPK